MKNKLVLAVGTFPKYLAFQFFFITYILSIFIHASGPSPKTYQPGMFFYLFPLMFAMLLVHLIYVSIPRCIFTKAHFIQATGFSIFYGFIWYALF